MVSVSNGQVSFLVSDDEVSVSDDEVLVSDDEVETPSLLSTLYNHGDHHLPHDLVLPGGETLHIVTK